MKTSGAFLRVMAVLVLALTAVIVPAQLAGASVAVNPNVTYFEETGHTLSYGFKYYWEHNGGLDSFGYPITEEFSEQNAPPPAGDGLVHTVQYFERARFEYHAELKGTPYETLLGLLGSSQTVNRRADQPFQAVALSSDTVSTRYFQQTGHTLSNSFKNYWEQNGGLMRFGYPISEEFDERNASPPAGDGAIHKVQYFERARFEYHPENANPNFQVLLGLIGWRAALDNNVPQSALARVPLPGTSPSPSPTPSPTPSPQPSPNPYTPLKGPHIGYGTNVWLLGVDQNRVLGLVKGAGFTWVRQQVRWEQIEPTQGQFKLADLDAAVNATYRNGVHLILSVVASPRWATANGGHGLPRNPADYQKMINALAWRYKGKVDAYEIWNEENIASEASNGRVDPATFVAVMKAGFQGVKNADPKAIVIFGGLSPTGVTDRSIALDDVQYLDEIYRVNNGEVRQYFDVLGAHPGGNANPPDDFYCPDDMAYCPDGGVDQRGNVAAGWKDHPSFFFRRIEQIRAVMEKYGDGNKQMWLTEFGWTTANRAPGYDYGAQNSEQDQANYIVRAFQKGKNDYPWMGVMAVWQLNFATVVGPNDEKAPWGLIRSDWSLRPSYVGMKNMAK